MKIFPVSLLAVLLLISGCAASQGYLKGVTADGKKVYLGAEDIQNTDAYRKFFQSSRTSVDEQQYLFARLKNSEGLEFLHDGTWYNKIQAYRGGLWLMRNKYKKGQSSREFIKKHITYSQAGNPHLVRYPDGSLQLGSDILLNELDLLEETLKQQS